MLRHHLLSILRNFNRSSITFFINLAGLSTGLTAALFIYLWVTDELSVDKFHEKDSQLFQVMKNVPTAEGIVTMSGTPARLAEAIAKEMPEVEYAASVSNSDWQSGKATISYENNKFNVEGQFVSKDFFNVFSYDFIEGDNETSLSDKYNIIISDALASKLFHGKDNVVGKMVERNHEGLTGSFLVSGVYKQLPATASMKADVLLHYELFLERNPKLEDWRNSDPDTYVVLKPSVDVDTFNRKIAAFLKGKTENSSASLFLQKYSEKYLHGNYENGKPAGGRIAYVTFFSIVAVFILLNACINFMNLSTAIATKRFKEVGVRKAIGANRKSLILQFMLESLLMSTLSSIVAVILIWLLLPWFNEITAKQFLFTFDLTVVVGGLVIVVFTGIISGSFPSFYLSSFNPVTVLKGKLQSYRGERWARKGLVLFQSMLSLIAIICTWVVYKQIDLVQTKNLGFNRDHVIYFERGTNTDIKDNKRFETELEVFLDKIKTIPGVINATNFRHDITNRQGGTTDVVWDGKDPENQTNFTDLSVGYDFIETLGIEMKEGRTYSRYNASDRSRSTVIFNEKAINAMGIINPIGKVIKIWGEEREIVGVVKDFHFQSFYNEIKPLFFDFGMNKRVSKIMVKIKSGTERETLHQLETIFAATVPGIPFEYAFLEKDYQKLYESENRVGVLSKYFAGIAIVISCLGLFGLTAFSAERRGKEIGIRKVFGARIQNIVYLLSRESVNAILISAAFAFPTAYFLSRRWLDSFVYRIELEWWHFAGGGLVILFITLLTIGAQVIKAALTSPAKALKDE